MPRHIPAALITAPASGQGKSMVTAALARLYRNQGYQVRVFKHGPDYLDPMVLEQASGHPVYQVHEWMTGLDDIRQRMADAAAQADVILVEGSMGLFDGDPCPADLAQACGLSVIPVIDANAMAQTFGAVAQGLARYRTGLSLTQVIANRVAGDYHRDLLARSLPEDLALLGAVPQHPAMVIPDRHLGIVQAPELPELDQQLDAAAAVLKDAGLEALPAAVSLPTPEPRGVPKWLEGRRIAVARDEAFAFIYRANLELLEAMGAELRFFSPLHQDTLPSADALWLPGGYPELHANTFAANRTMQQSLHEFFRSDRPILAECGGLMVCMEGLTDQQSVRHPMLGWLQGESRMADGLRGLGMQALPFKQQELRGHTFHHSELHTTEESAFHGIRDNGSAAEPVLRKRGLLATYVHSYFPSSPEAVASLFRGEA